MTISAIVLLAAMTHPHLTVDTSRLGDFFRYPDELFFDPPATPPGDADFYAPLTIETGGTWNVYTNGLWALTNETVRMINAPAASMAATDNFELYHVAIEAWEAFAKLRFLKFPPETDTYAWRPNLFDFGWRSNFGTLVRFVYNGGGTERPIGDVTGLGELYHPRSFRLDNRTYTSLLASYAAYFERLYYASEGQESEWSGSWGDPDSTETVPFNVTNEGYSADCYFDWGIGTNGCREIEFTRRLTERPRLKRLREIMRGDMFSADVAISPGEKPENHDFIYRPGWVLDGDANPDSNHVSRLWWSSQADPPSTNGIKNLFFPSFEWSDDPIRIDGIDWDKRCITLNMGRQALPLHPAAVLFRNLGLDDPQLDSYVTPYAFCGHPTHGLYMWLTNAYPLCVRQYYDAAAAWSGYLDSCWGFPRMTDPPYRLVPNDYTGVNQLLGLMDRTIHIPSMLVVSTNEEYCVFREAEYEGSPVTFYAHIDEDGYITVDQSTLSTICDRTLTESDVITNVATRFVVGIEASATAPSFVFSAGQPVVGSETHRAVITSNVLFDYGEDGHNTMWIIDALAIDRWPRELIAFNYSLDGIHVHTGEVGVPDGGWHGRYEVLPREMVGREYSYEEPVWARCRLGVTQPGRSIGGSVDAESVFVMLERSDIRNGSRYRAVGPAAYYDHDNLQSAADPLCMELADEVYNTIPSAQGDPFGPMPWDIYSYAPMPELPFPCEVKATGASISRRVVDATFTPSIPRDYTNNVYCYWFEAYSNLVFRSYDVVEAVTNRFDKHYVVDTTTYPEGGWVVTNDLYYSGDSYYELGSGASTNTCGETSEFIAYDYMAGPFPAPQETCQVPYYEGTTDVYRVESPTIECIFDMYHIHDTGRSGNPGDPGEVLWERDYAEEFLVHEDVFNHPSTNVVGAGASEVYYSVPTSQAVRITGGEVVTVPGFLYIEFDKDWDTFTVSNIRVYRKWTNPFTGEVETEDEPFPVVLGTVTVYVSFGYSAEYRGGPVGGPTTDAYVSGDAKIITQTDWKFNTMKREQGANQ